MSRPIWRCRLLPILILLSCAPPPPPPTDTLSTEELALIQPGDIILRRTTGVAGLLIAEKMREKVPLTHVAVCDVRDGRVSIIQSVGGGTKRVVKFGTHHVTPGEFCASAKAGSIVVTRLKAPEEVRAKIAAAARRYDSLAVPFDYDYDLDEHTRMYCTELVYLCVIEALGNDIFRRISVADSKEFIPFDEFLDTARFEVILDHTAKAAGIGGAAQLQAGVRP